MRPSMPLDSMRITPSDLESMPSARMIGMSCSEPSRMGFRPLSDGWLRVPVKPELLAPPPAGKLPEVRNCPEVVMALMDALVLLAGRCTAGGAKGLGVGG